MDPVQFAQLCRSAGTALHLDNPDALAHGQHAYVDQVAFELVHDAQRGCVLILADLGAPPDVQRETIYEHLLSLQLMSWSQPSLRFGFDPKRQMLLLCGTTATDGLSSGRLVMLLRCIAAQVVDWRGNLLAGMLQFPNDYQLHTAPLQRTGLLN